MNIHDATTIQHFFIKAMAHLEFVDVFPAIIKTVFFGYFIGIIGCYKGYNAPQGNGKCRDSRQFGCRRRVAGGIRRRPGSGTDHGPVMTTI